MNRLIYNASSAIVFLLVLTRCISFVTPLDDLCEAYNAIDDTTREALQFSKTKSLHTNYEDRPRPDQKSLLIVFDKTSSMASDLAQLRKGALEIVTNFSTREDNPIFNYILQLFDDPSKFQELIRKI